MIFLGITTTNDESNNARLAKSYITAARQANALPLLLPTLAPEDAGRVLRVADALVLTGGGDVAAPIAGYGHESLLSGVDAARDEWEIALVRAFAAEKKPMLGICRGMQVMNLALGGALCPHIPLSGIDEEHSLAPDVRHALRWTSPMPFLSHVHSVNSAHHQAVSIPADGFNVYALSGGGVIECVAHESFPWIGVQWHPERLNHGTLVFSALCAAAERKSLAFYRYTV